MYQQEDDREYLSNLRRSRRLNRQIDREEIRNKAKVAIGAELIIIVVCLLILIVSGNTIFGTIAIFTFVAFIASALRWMMHR